MTRSKPTRQGHRPLDTQGLLKDLQKNSPAGAEPVRSANHATSAPSRGLSYYYHAVRRVMEPETMISGLRSEVHALTGLNLLAANGIVIGRTAFFGMVNAGLAGVDLGARVKSAEQHLPSYCLDAVVGSVVCKRIMGRGGARLWRIDAVAERLRGPDNPAYDIGAERQMIAKSLGVDEAAMMEIAEPPEMRLRLGVMKHSQKDNPRALRDLVGAHLTGQHIVLGPPVIKYS